MKIKSLFAFFVLFKTLVFSQNIWVANATSDATSESMDIVMDAAGNSYITGYISGDAEFQNIQIDINLGYSDAIVAKIDDQGRYVWVKRFNGPLSDKGIKIALNSSNEIIITGTYYNTITFGSVTLNAVANSKDIFLAKLSNDGDVIWARSDGGAMGDNPYGLTLDSQDNIILTGQFEGISTIGPNTFTSMIDPETNLPSFDMFLAKYDGNGTPLWSKASYAEYEDRGLSVVCDANNNIYMTGQFSDTINFFGQTINNQIYNAGFVSKFTPSGTEVWFDKLAASQVLAYDITLNNAGQVIVTGDFLGQLVVWNAENQSVVNNPYSKKIFVLKLNTNGGYIWGRAKGSNSEVSSRTVCVDSQDNIYIGGHFRCNFDEYRDSTGTAFWQSVGFRDQYVTKFTTNGATVWKNHVGGQKEDQCWGIAIFEDDYPIITGSYGRNIIFPFNQSYSFSNISNSNVHAYTSSSNNNVQYSYTTGDESINIHTSKMINSNSKYYNYYLNSSSYSDSIPFILTPDVDSLISCPSVVACVSSRTMNNYGPLYEGQWSNGTNYTSCLYFPPLSGTYSVYVERLDLCYNFDDTINVQLLPVPTLPLLTDDHSVNLNASPYLDIVECEPDTLNFFFQNLCANCEATISIGALGYSGSLTLDSAYQLTQSSLVSVGVTNEYGCSVSDNFLYSLIPQETISYDTISPYLILNDSYDLNDSIMICRNLGVSVIVADAFTNPGGSLIPQPEDTIYSATSLVTNNLQLVMSGTDGRYLTFYPQQTGWYVITVNLILGDEIVNQCQELVDTTKYQIITDSFYVDIKENPNITFLGGELLCPDTYNFLSYSPLVENAVWFGDSILWTSDDGDSIKINESGTYGISGSYDYGEVQCPFTKSVYIGEKAPPLIVMDPQDGIVCPGDSVHLWLSETGSAYEWIGPEGNTLSTNPDIYDDDQGFYACIFTDDDGCQLLTAQAEIREYTTPFIIFEPNNFICEFEPIDLTVIYGGDAQLLWHSPINSSSETVTINQPGTYTCEVTQCGFTVVDSITIIDASFDVSISAESTNLCIGDTIRITATPGLSIYEWSNGFVALNFLEVTAPGTYSVTAYNEYGCASSSDSITIIAFPESYPPLIEDVFVCVGNDAFVTHPPTSFNFGWYNSTMDTSPFSSADTLFYTNVNQDITIYAANQSANCPLNFTEVLIDVLFPLTPPEIIGDTTVCIGENIVLSTGPVPNGSYFWVYGGDTLSTGLDFVLSDFDQSDPTLVEVYIEDGCTDASNFTTIELMFPSPISIDITSDTLCYGENLVANVSGSGNLNFYWTDGLNNWTSPTINVSYFDLASNLVQVYGINADDCHSETLSIDLTLSPDLDLNVNMDTITCLGNEILLQTNESLQDLIWILPSGETLNSQSVLIEALTYADSGLYIVQGLNQYNCPIDDSLNMSILNLPEFSLGNDSILCAENSYDIFIPNLGYQFLWDGNAISGSITPSGSEPIIIEAINTSGCHFLDTLSIQLVDCSGQAMNFITPNGDGHNDYFEIVNAEYSYNNCLLIMNRWGNVVYESNYYRNDFGGIDKNGKQLNDGVYFYLYYKDCEMKREVTHQGYFHIFTKE